MKQKVILVLIVLVAGIATPVVADSQVDIGVNVPGWIGVSIDGQNLTEEIPFRIPIPDPVL